MKITFLGTGTSHGIPMINSDHPVCRSTDSRDKRLRSSVLITWNDYHCLIDCGPDFRYQMLRANISKIDSVLFTHEHADHIAGLDDIRPFCFKQGTIPIYGLKRVIDSLQKRYDYIFEKQNRYPGAPSVDEHVVTNEVLKLGGIEILPIEVMHGNLEILGYRFSNMAYLTDVKTLSDVSIKKLQGLDVLIINALRVESHFTHLNLEEALILVDEIKPKKVYFTHISHHLGFHKEVEMILPENVFLAYDGLEIYSSISSIEGG